MEKKLKKIRSLDDLEVGGRYCLLPELDLEFTFVIYEITNTKVFIEYANDGARGIFFKKHRNALYEAPYTSLEKELL